MAINWSSIYKKYKGLWVALGEDETTVIASGKTAREAWEGAKNKGFPKPILAQIPKELSTYIGFDL